MSPISVQNLKVKKGLLCEPETLASIDRGCSLTKIMYLPKDGQNDNENYVFNLELFSNTKFEEALDQLKEHAILPNSGIIPVSGVGCDMYRDVIHSKLQLKPSFQDEFKSHSAGIHFLKENMEEDVYSTLPPAKVNAPEETDEVPPYAKEWMAEKDKFFHVKGPFPFLFVALGSAVQIHLINADGSEKTVSTCMQGGQTLMGLGKFLLGTNDYDRIEEMASEGERANVDTTMQEITKSNSEYGIFPDNFPVLSFGKAFTQDKGISDFNPCDVAHSLVNSMAGTVMSIVHAVSKGYGIKNILIGGNMIRGATMRAELQKYNCFEGFGSPVLNIRFLNFGHTSALGAILMSSKPKT